MSQKSLRTGELDLDLQGQIETSKIGFQGQIETSNWVSDFQNLYFNC